MIIYMMIVIMLALPKELAVQNTDRIMNCVLVRGSRVGICKVKFPVRLVPIRHHYCEAIGEVAAHHTSLCNVDLAY